MTPPLVAGSKEFNRRNERRFELIQKRVRQGLAADEEAEFQQLQAEILRVTRARFPVPPIPEAKRAAGAVVEHLEYLRRLTADRIISTELADKARSVWPGATEGLPVPAATARPGGPIEYYWDAGPHQLVAEIPAVGPCHWTYRNRATGEVRGIEAPAHVGWPMELKSILERFVAQALPT